MRQGKARTVSSCAGFTFVEAMVTSVILSVLIGGIFAAISGIQGSFVQSQVISVVNLRAQSAMDRMTRLARQAITSDLEFSALKPTTGENSHALRFRLIDSFDAVTGAPNYNDTHKVYIFGPDSGTHPNEAVLLCRGPDLTTIFNSASGADGLLGTNDDDPTPISGTIPAVELLVPANFAPSTGEMFTVNIEPGSDGRLITLTLRLNAPDGEGGFMLAEDLVYQERVALHQ